MENRGFVFVTVLIVFCGLAISSGLYLVVEGNLTRELVHASGTGVLETALEAIAVAILLAPIAGHHLLTFVSSTCDLVRRNRDVLPGGGTASALVSTSHPASTGANSKPSNPHVDKLVDVGMVFLVIGVSLFILWGIRLVNSDKRSGSHSSTETVLHEKF